jgi:hypothetical protein
MRVEKRTIYPTFECFDDAVEIMGELIQQDLEHADDLRIVHAICRVPTGEDYAHGWVEDLDAGICVWAGILDGERQYFMSPTADFMKSHRVQECTKYDRYEVLDWNQKTGHVGPWEERYRALCNVPGEPPRAMGVINGD